jgi:hypothetical protein
MMRKNEKMFNKKQLIAKEIENQLLQSVLREDNDFDSIRNKDYQAIGLDYWGWIDLLANLEVIFRKDLTETSEKFKIATVDELINALYNAPEMKSIFKIN